MKIERTTLNAQTIRIEGDDKEVKISILKDKHYRGIAKIAFGDAAEIAAELVTFLHGPDARIVTE